MKTIQLEKVARINPPKNQNLDDNMLCSFVPMEYVDETIGAIVDQDIRSVMEVKSGYTAFRDGDVLFAKITPCMENGKVALASGLINGIGFGSTEFHVIRAGESILAEWIYYYLRQRTIRDFAERNMTGSAGQKRVPTRILETLEIPLPTLDEQKRLMAIMRQAELTRRRQKEALYQSEQLIASLTHYAFLGEL